MLSHYPASYPVILDMATSWSLNTLFGFNAAEGESMGKVAA